MGGSITLEEYILNAIADKLADLAVRLFDYPLDVGLEVDRKVPTAFFASMRLAVVEYERAQWAN